MKDYNEVFLDFQTQRGVVYIFFVKALAEICSRNVNCSCVCKGIKIT